MSRSFRAEKQHFHQSSQSKFIGSPLINHTRSDLQDKLSKKTRRKFPENNTFPDLIKEKLAYQTTF